MASGEQSTPQTRQENFEQAVALTLHLWPALTLAVQNNWSANNAEEVRDWFCGSVVELFPDFVDLANAAASGRQLDVEEPDADYVESRLLQVMADEFDVEVQDDSSYEMASQIVRLRAECAAGKFDGVVGLRQRYETRKGQKVVMQQGPDQDQDTDWESASEDDDHSEDSDNRMGNAPALVSAPVEKPQPEVDEDGFTKVVKKR